MPIVHVAPTQFGGSGLFGGGERYPLELTRALSRGADVELVTFGPAPRVVTEPSGLRITVLPAAGHGWRHPAQPIPARLLPLRRADLVHTHHTRSLPSRLAAVAARSTGTPLVTTDHGLGGGGWGGLLPALFDRFLVVSRFAAGVLRVPPSRTRVIYGGADPDRFHPDPALTRDGVLFVGRLTPHKGIDRLLQALPAGAALTVAGSAGHDRERPERDYPQLLRRLAVGRDVTFVGAVTEPELRRLYQRAQVLVAPSVELTCYGRRHAISELLGLTVLEAMASGTPVVASRLGGLAEVIRDGETGFLVPPGDVAQLRDRLTQLLGDRDLARRMGRRARELVLAEFTWQRCAQRCQASYDELLRR